MARITFTRERVNSAHDEYWVSIDGQTAGILTRERPTRTHASTRGQVYDRERPWVWDYDGASVDIPDGSTVAQAKAIVRNAHK